MDKFSQILGFQTSPNLPFTAQQDRPVRSDTAVTGEITLRGHILPVGGIRDKVLAAHRAGIRHVLVPYGNQRHPGM